MDGAVSGLETLDEPPCWWSPRVADVMAMPSAVWLGPPHLGLVLDDDRSLFLSTVRYGDVLTAQLLGRTSSAQLIRALAPAVDSCPNCHYWNYLAAPKVQVTLGEVIAGGSRVRATVDKQGVVNALKYLASAYPSQQLMVVADVVASGGSIRTEFSATLLSEDSITVNEHNRLAMARLCLFTRRARARPSPRPEAFGDGSGRPNGESEEVQLGPGGL